MVLCPAREQSEYSITRARAKYPCLVVETRQCRRKQVLTCLHLWHGQLAEDVAEAPQSGLYAIKTLASIPCFAKIV